MAEPQVTNSLHYPPIGYYNQSEAQTMRLRGLTGDSGSNTGYLATRFGLDPLKDDSEATGGGAADRLPAGGVPAQALSPVAINKKP
jgi:hypothetical protein